MKHEKMLELAEEEKEQQRLKNDELHIHYKEAMKN